MCVCFLQCSLHSMCGAISPPTFIPPSDSGMCVCVGGGGVNGSTNFDEAVPGLFSVNLQYELILIHFIYLFIFWRVWVRIPWHTNAMQLPSKPHTPPPLKKKIFFDKANSTSKKSQSLKKGFRILNNLH